MYEFVCPECSEVLHIPEKYIGSKGTCRKCQSPIVVGPATHQNGNGHSASSPPNLVVLQLETTGPASRKHAIIEIGCIKLDLAGKELDSFWTFCNPDQHISSKIIDRTGITEDMVAQSPYPNEGVKEFFDWVGPNPIIFTDHPHYTSKFLSATLLREDIVPPQAKVVDIIEWSRERGIQVKGNEFRLRTVLDTIGFPISNEHHRSMDSCHGMQHLVQYLMAKETQMLLKNEHPSLFGKLLQKHTDEEQQKLFISIINRSQKMKDSCGNPFYELQAYEARKSGVPLKSVKSSVGNNPDLITHMPEWFEEKREKIKGIRSLPREDFDPFEDHSSDTAWEFALIEASQSASPEERRRFLMRAIDLNASDPKPYEHLMGYYIREKNYISALEICEKYFESKNWEQPQFAGSSLKMLDRYEKLEHKLARG